MPLFPDVLTVLAAIVYVRGARARRSWPHWRTALFLLGLVALVAALASPIDPLALELFSVHMVQHMLLLVVAAPLLLAGGPVRPLLRGLPSAVRRTVVRALARNTAFSALVHLLRHPLVAAALYVAGLYAWHIPVLYDAAVENMTIHVLEHSWFLVTALLFWSVVIDPVPFRATLPYAARIPFLLLVGAAQNTILGGLLAFSDRPFYRPYLETTAKYGLDPATDQRLGGAIMWVPGDLIFLAAASFAFFLWLQSEEQAQRLRESGQR
ncbi:MAG TPA: cytochrome c oxidase assembly protein [Candidatus Limnocylindria bacterium]|nr:cytochrome c oxidase assembly protein [Candidatus Limnocylindria bacterium]